MRLFSSPEDAQAALQALLDQHPDPMAIKDLEGRFAYANAAALDLLQSDLETVRGKTLRQVLGDELGSRSEEADRRLLETGAPETIEWEYRMPNGRLRAYSLTCSLYFGPSGERLGILVSLHEISRRRQAERDLELSDTRYFQLLQAAFEGVAIHDNGVILEADEGLATLFGYPLNELIGMNAIQIARPEYRALIMRNIRTGYDRPYEVEGVRPDGHPIYVEMFGQRYYYKGRWVRVAAFRDISERKRVEAKRREYEALLDLSQQLAKLGSWEWAPSTRRFTCSEELYRIFQIDKEDDLRGEDFLERVPPEDQEMILRIARQALRDHQPFDFVHRMYMPDGSERIIQAHGKVEVNAQGKVLRVIGASQDVTERYRLEETLREQNEKLKELDRLKNGFISTVSHELRTPLASIMGYAEFLEDEVAGPLNDEQRAFVRQLLLGAQRLQVLVDDLLDVARIDSGSFRIYPREADLAEKVREIVNSLQPQAKEASLLLEAELPAEPLIMAFDPDRIGQVLLNLLGNAVKFTPRGGSIQVRVMPREAEVRIEVEDSGIGIAEANVPKLFQKFFQIDPSTTREKGGAGLGLSIAKALIEAHGGTIGVDSYLGCGSTFWFQLPRELPATQIGEATPESARRQGR